MQRLLCHLNATCFVGIPSLVRVDYAITKKVLEMGPDGILLPMVRTVAGAD